MSLNKLTSISSGRSSYPLDFSVQTESNQGELSPVLYIENIDNAHDLHWSVMNVGSDEKYIQKLDGDPSVDHYHFQLKFRPGTLANHFTVNTIPRFSVSDSEGVTWKMNTFKDTSSNIVYVSLLASEIASNEGKLILKPNQPFHIIIDKVTANPVGGARNTNVELRYNHILNSSDPDNILSGSRMQHLGIVNHDGLRNIPLLPETMGSNTILNNGTPTDIDIQITNYSKNGITLSNKENDQSAIEIVLKVPLEDDKGNLLESGELFLAKKSHLNQVELIWADQEHWDKSTKEETPDSITWTITNKSQDRIESGHSLDFILKNVVTDLPEGQAKIQINYFNIPGYWDGTLFLDIIKAPMVFRDKKVGIGPEKPEVPLCISGKVTDLLKIQSTSGGIGNKAGIDFATFGGIGKNARIEVVDVGSFNGDITFLTNGDGEHGTVKERVRIAHNGNVGIRTATPSIDLAIGDGDTGLKQQGDDKLAIYTNNQERLRLENNGHVGIGTTSPLQRLHVAGNAVFGGWIAGSGAAGTPFNIYGANGDPGGQQITVKGGSLGIGTDSPSEKLHVVGDAIVNNAFIGEVGYGSDWAGFRHNAIRETEAYGLLQNNNGQFTMINKKSGGGYIGLRVDNQDKMVLIDNGNVGIGTTSPKAPLDVGVNIKSLKMTASYSYISQYHRENVGAGTHDTVSIVAGGAIVSAGQGQYSDQRIKTELVQSDPVKDLQTLLRLKVTEYEYIDKIKNDSRPKKGLIAQEVEKQLPNAVSEMTGFVPDVFQPVTSFKIDVQSAEITCVLEQPHLIHQGDVLRLITDQAEVDKEVSRIVDEHTFILKDWTDKTENLFVYGKQVDDFRTVDYDQVAMLGVSATQELAHQVNTLKQEMQILQKENQSLREELGELKSLKAEMKELSNLMIDFSKNGNTSALSPKGKLLHHTQKN